MLKGLISMPLNNAVETSTSTVRVEVLGTESSGREWDSETGMYFYRARYYSPDLKRFTSEDPIRFASGDVNFYRYVGNNPTNFIDPLGLFWGTAALRGGSKGVFSAGPGALAGGIAGAYIGAGVGAFVGTFVPIPGATYAGGFASSVAVGAFGSWVGGFFDEPDDGQAGYGEDEY